jgi:putative SOS response-associated peptidase YedK
MPVILRPEHEEAWVTEKISDREALQLLLPLDDGAFHAHTVSHMISSKDADPADPRIIESFQHPVSGSLF